MQAVRVLRFESSIEAAAAAIPAPPLTIIEMFLLSTATRALSSFFGRREEPVNSFYPNEVSNKFFRIESFRGFLRLSHWLPLSICQFVFFLNAAIIVEGVCNSREPIKQFSVNLKQLP